MYTGDLGDMTLVNRDPGVITIVANVVSKYATTGEFSVTQYEYSKLPGWAKAILDFAKRNPSLAGICLSVLAYIVGQMVNIGTIALDNYMDHKSDLLLQDRQFQHDLNVLAATKVSGKSPCDRDREVVPDLWDKLLARVRDSYQEMENLREGREVTDAELQIIIDDYNRNLNLLYQIISEDRKQLERRVSGQIELKPSLGSFESQPATAPKQGRNSPCLCGSGKKYKKCCGSI